MRRSICYCNPSSALAGSVGEWRFIYTTAVPLPKGTKLKFDIVTQGRDIDWEVPHTNPKSLSNIIYAEIDQEQDKGKGKGKGKSKDKSKSPAQSKGKGKILSPKEIEVKGSFVPQYEFTLPKDIKEGSSITIVMGQAKGGRKKIENAGNTAQTLVQRRRPFLLHVDPKGKGLYEEPEAFLMDIRGNALHNIRIITPSFVAKNKRFDVTIRFEDAFGNLTSNAPEDTLIELTYEQLRENLNWKIFVPETGFITLPNLYFNEDGVYTIQLRNMKTGDLFRSAPIHCMTENNTNIFWGLLHGESEKVDSTENIESCLRHFRDEKSFNFFATSPFDNAEETPTDIWKLIVNNVAEFNEPERFVNMLGFQWNGSKTGEGVRHFVYLKDNKPLLRQKDPKSNSLKKIYRSLVPGEAISIPTFSMGKGISPNFAQHNPEFERVIEIYNAWGSSECPTKQKNPLPVHSKGRSGIKENPEGAVRAALNRNCRFGFVAGGLDDRSIYADLFESDQEQYHPGCTAIIATEQTREALMKALYDRSCYATTGVRMILGLFVAGAPMGSELCSAEKPGLIVNRHLSGHVAGTSDIKAIEIIRNGEVLKTIRPKNYTTDFVYDDMTPLNKVAQKSPDKRPPFVYYYLRVFQKDGHVGWSSPIWVDYVAKKKA